nr:MerR family transcriptional regulator [uncultured Kingella sp.]
MYTISQFAEQLGISTDTLRYYEKEGLLAPQRNAAGYRVYTERDEVWFGFVKRLKDTGMPMAQIKRYAELRHAGDATLAERCAMLEAHRQALVEKQRELAKHQAHLDDKIRHYAALLRQAK